MRKGLVQPTATPTQTNVGHPHVRARVVQTREVLPSSQQQRSMVIQPGQMQNEPPVRGVILDTGGKLIRGLSQATVQAHKAHNENATEQCNACGDFKPPGAFTTVVANAYNPNNPLRTCDQCTKLNYKDPRDERQQWRPAVPAVRFDRERGSVYNAHEAGVTIRDLVTRDTYHKERDVSPEYRAEHAPQEGRWSGGGKAGHQQSAQSLDRSRQAAARVRR